MFATSEDIAARLGRDLGSDETAPVELLLELATSFIAEAAGKTDDWADALDPVPTVLRGLCIEVVSRALGNPQGITNLSETLGQHTSSIRFRDYEGAGLMLTPVERRLVRRTVLGRTVGSARTRSILDDFGS